jgi:RecB family exonuclease
VREAIARLAGELPPRLVIERDEALDLVREELRREGRVQPGGSGAGVQVLGVVEARARTFARLFVIGVNRDVFPRQVREDWLLPDRLRAALLPVLPDMPLKRTSHDEERYLFAELASAAPTVTVSWTECDDDGRSTPASPLAERLCDGDHSRAPLLPDHWAAGGGIRPAHEHLVLAGLHGSRDRFAAVLPTALAAGSCGAAAAPCCAGAGPCGAGVPPALSAGPESLQNGSDGAGKMPAPQASLASCGAGVPPAPSSSRASEPLPAGAVAAALAAARVAVLDELDPDRRTAAGRARAAAPGPYFGFVGAVPPGAGDPRDGDVWVTALEAAARCPWQMFLSRLLRLEPVPDAGGELPPFSGAVLGSAVHTALEEIARSAAESGPETVAEAAAAPARLAAWPDDEAFERVLAAAAEAALRDEGLALPLLVRGLAERARPFLDAARRTDFATPAHVAGAELVGAATVTDVEGRARSVAFRADRADRSGESLVLTDYKTGRGITASGKDSFKRRALLKGIAAGQLLQAAAYAAAGCGVAGGRYLFLKPEIDDAAREVTAGADGEVLGALRDSATALLALYDAGAFFPRLVTADGRQEGPGCGGCGVREACLAGDTGARRRLLAWTAAVGRDAAADPQARAAERIWRLGSDLGDGEGTT